MSVDLMTVPEVAALCRIDAQTVYSWRARGVGPLTFRLNGRVVADRADVEAWIKAQHAAARGAA